jgi:hypothetical protein
MRRTCALVSPGVFIRAPSNPRLVLWLCTMLFRSRLPCYCTDLSLRSTQHAASGIAHQHILHVAQEDYRHNVLFPASSVARTLDGKISKQCSTMRHGHVVLHELDKHLAHLHTNVADYCSFATIHCPTLCSTRPRHMHTNAACIILRNGTCTNHRRSLGQFGEP